MRHNNYTAKQLRDGIEAILQRNPNLGHVEARRMMREAGFTFSSEKWNPIWKEINMTRKRVRAKQRPAEASELNAWLDMGRELFGETKFEVRLLP